MKYKAVLLHLAFLLGMVASVYVTAEVRYEQKLILVQGDESRFMKGEKKPVFDFKKDED